MTFQASPLRAVQTTGLAGEVARESGAFRSDPWILNSSGTPNVIGYAYHKVADGEAEVGGGDTGVFVGILTQPKEHALVGSGSSNLTASNVLADGLVGSLVTMGILYIQLDGSGAAGTVGASLYSTDATGAIGVGTAGAGETQIPNAKIVLEDVADDGLAIVAFTN